MSETLEERRKRLGRKARARSAKKARRQEWLRYLREWVFRNYTRSGGRVL